MSSHARLELPAIVLFVAILLPVAAGQSVGRPVPATLDALRNQLDAHVGAPRFTSALWSVKIVSLETGRTWFEHGPERLMSPASNTKLYVGALALDRLGAEYRIRTPVSATAQPDADGTLRGDLIVSGRGDPSWKTRPGAREFASLFDPVISVLANSGVRRITGDVIADATYFRTWPHGAGWVVDDLDEYYGAEISAVSLEQNYTAIRVTPAAEPGTRCEVTLMHPHTGLRLDNRTLTGARGTTGELHVYRLFGERDVQVFGERPAGSAPESVEVTVPRPAQWFAEALRAALIARGIAVGGIARSLRWPEASAAPSFVTLGEIASPTMAELVAGFMKPSQNLETDLIFAHLGEKFRPAGTPAWRTSEQCAVRLLGEFLEEHALLPEDVRFEEGSGLSRNNLVSANAIVALLTFMARHRDADVFSNSLPIAGVDGTLRRRMKATAAEGHVRAKTGTLRWANSLSGYARTAAGERLVFSVLLNRAVAAPGQSNRDDVDAIAVMLAEFAGRDS